MRCPDEGSLLFYKYSYAKFYCFLQAYAAAGTVNQNYANILLMLLRLRQACDHPLLVKGYDSDSVGKDSVATASTLSREMLIELLNALESSEAICCVCNVSFYETFPNWIIPYCSCK